MFSVFRQSRRIVRLGNFLRPQRVFPPRAVSYFCTNTIPNSINFAAITNGHKDVEHRLKVLILELEVLRQEGRNIPDYDYFNEKHWKELLELPTFTQRRKYVDFIFKVMKKKENRKTKKEDNRARYEVHLANKPPRNENETLEEFAQQYDLGHNNIMLRVYDTTINQFYNNRLVQAMQFGQKLVVDCGYNDEMTKQENKNCAKQLCLLFAENRNHADPFDLHFCNINRENLLMQTLHGLMSTMYEPSFPLHLHEKSYLELETFDKDQLVYLTPHCREEMVHYDHDAIYIIGGIVDKVNTQPLSLAKAKRQGLRMAKLPLDRYLQWGSGSGKSLTLNQVAAILLDVKQTGDWKYALRHVPRRKIADIGEEEFNKRKFWRPRSPNFKNLSYKGPNDRIVKVSSIMTD